MLAYKIAKRYIFAYHSFNFITVITFISILGITVGVAALIIVTSIFKGYGEFTERMMVGLDPHIRISAGHGAWINNVDSLLIKIKKIPDIKAASPSIQGRIIAIKGTNMQVFTLNAVKPNEISSVTGISNTIVIGKFNLENINGLPGLVLGSSLSSDLNALPGDTVKLISPLLIEKAILYLNPNTGLKAIVTGIFHSNTLDYDKIYGYISDESSQFLYNAPKNSAFNIDIKLNSISDVDIVKGKLERIFEKKLVILTWYDLHKEFYNVLKFERMAAFVVLSLIIIIAVFNVLASLSMTVVEKRRDIAVLKAIGAKNSTILKIFLTEGILIGLISSVAGTILGLGFCYGQLNFKWFKLDETKYLIDSIPLTIDYINVLFILLFSLGLSFLATIYPSTRASKTNITESIRTE
jgi:lipoprotein-releasing system permease protein